MLFHLDSPTLIVALGVEAQQNLFVDANDVWDAATYLPAYVRRHPFCMTRVSVNGQEQADRIACVEKNALQAKGTALFDDKGEPLPVWDGLRKLPFEFEADLSRSDEMARKLGADVVNRDGIRIRELPAPLQQVMLDLQIGQSTPPYGSLQDGVRVFVLCGRDAPQEAASESFDEIMSRLEEERVNKRARIYLRDLRRDAVIEYN